MRKILPLFMLIFCPLLTVHVLGVDIDKRDDINKLIQKTQQEISNKKKKEKSVLDNLAKQQQDLVRLEKNFEAIKDQLVKIQNKVNLTKKQLQLLQSNLSSLEQNLQKTQHLLNQRLVAVYKHGPESYLEILLSSESFVDLLNRFNTIAYFVKNDLKLIDQLKENKKVVNAQHKAVQEKTRQYESEYKIMVSVRDKVSQEEKKISQKVALTKQELTKIQRDRAKLEKALEEYEETSREIEAELKKSGLANAGEALGTGKMIWPLKGRLSSSFGWRTHPVLRKKKFHNGQDIAVPSGTPVYAADSGKVVVSGWLNGYGNYIAINHGRGISTGYAHNSRLLVSVGEIVYKGQKIALSGNTGLSTGPHLHFEVRINGVPVNPIPYLP